MEHRNRGFLNEEEGLAAFEWAVYSTDDNWTSADFTISDCYRQITLEFGYYGEECKQNRLKKVDLLISELTKFREVLDKGYLQEKEDSNVT